MHMTWGTGYYTCDAATRFVISSAVICMPRMASINVQALVLNLSRRARRSTGRRCLENIRRVSLKSRSTPRAAARPTLRTQMMRYSRFSTVLVTSQFLEEKESVPPSEQRQAASGRLSPSRAGGGREWG